MGRPLRFVPDNCLVEVTTRTMQGRLLLRPAAGLNGIVLGVLGRGLRLWPSVKLFAFAFLSNHYHMLLRSPDTRTLSAFMGFLNSNVAREVGRLHSWPERFWGRRFRSIPVLDDAAALSRLKYILAHGAKEGLVASPLAWPGPSCAAALAEGTQLAGTWFDRTGAYLARRRGEPVNERDYSEEYPVPLQPLPAWKNLLPEERCSRIRRIIQDIETEARAAARGGRLPDPDGVQARDPHTRPARMKRSPAPLVHVSCPCMRLQFRRRYRAFVAAWRAAASQATAAPATAMDPTPRSPSALGSSKLLEVPP